jgi:hypothetical protein
MLSFPLTHIFQDGHIAPPTGKQFPGGTPPWPGSDSSDPPERFTLARRPEIWTASAHPSPAAWIGGSQLVKRSTEC